MGLNELKQKILSDADGKIAQVKKEGDAEICEIRARYKTRLEEDEERILGQAGKKAELSRREIVGSARVEGKVSVLEAKRAFLDELFVEAEKRVLRLSDSCKRKVLVRLVSDAKELGDCVVYASDSCISLVPKECTVKKGDFTDFGVVIESLDGAKKVDNRLPTALSVSRARIEHELNKILWGSK